MLLSQGEADSPIFLKKAAQGFLKPASSECSSAAPTGLSPEALEPLGYARASAMCTGLEELSGTWITITIFDHHVKQSPKSFLPAPLVTDSVHSSTWGSLLQSIISGPSSSISICGVWQQVEEQLFPPSPAWGTISCTGSTKRWGLRRFLCQGTYQAHACSLLGSKAGSQWQPPEQKGKVQFSARASSWSSLWENMRHFPTEFSKGENFLFTMQ